MKPPFDLSIVLAEAKDNPELGPVLAAIEVSCTGLSTEVLVVRPPGRPALPPTHSIMLRELITEEDSLVPDRWGQGVRAVQAPCFACLTTELTVSPEWGRTLLEALATGAAGSSGAITLAPGAGLTATAVYLVRFSAFLPRRGDRFQDVAQIPGDAASYKRDAVWAVPELLSEGFWEADFHRHFLAHGKRLLYLDRPLASFQTALHLRSAMTLRARHGHGFGVTRVRRHGDSRTRLLLTAPVVPLVLLLRILRRAGGSPGGWWLAVRAFPALVMLCTAWAWGEASGAWSARSGA